MVGQHKQINYKMQLCGKYVACLSMDEKALTVVVELALLSKLPQIDN